MNTVHRFFRRYIFSTVGIVILFLAVNLALFFTILITGSISGADPSFSVQDFSDHVVLQDEKWVADDTALSMLQEQSAWAMLLDEDGDVVWQQDLPENLPRSYTSAEVASFSRWYLEDYPVKIWTRADGNLILFQAILLTYSYSRGFLLSSEHTAMRHTLYFEPRLSIVPPRLQRRWVRFCLSPFSRYFFLFSRRSSLCCSCASCVSTCSFSARSCSRFFGFAIFRDLLF